jgi:pimeloyl-ACP methyl ester carboxylesterase
MTWIALVLWPKTSSPRPRPLPDDALNPRVGAWRDRGNDEEFRGRRIHVFDRDGSGPLLLLLHGFPSSSYDWRLLLERQTDHAVLAPDFLGFGLSEKPRDHAYTLHWQADMVEELVRRHGAGREVFFVAHDMGTSVANELMARDLDGSLEMVLIGGLLLNGSMVQDAASPTLGQRILRSAVGGLFSRLSSERFFRQQFGSIFSPDHPLTDEEAEDQWELVCAGGGRTLNHKTIRYMEERFKHADRWHGAIRDWQKPLSLGWGMLDPVATEQVLDAVVALRPSAPLTRFEDLGHYPQIEDPGRAADLLQAALDA